MLQRPLAISFGLVVALTFTSSLENQAQQSTSPLKPLPDGPVILTDEDDGALLRLEPVS